MGAAQPTLLYLSPGPVPAALSALLRATGFSLCGPVTTPLVPDRLLAQHQPTLALLRVDVLRCCPVEWLETISPALPTRFIFQATGAQPGAVLEGFRRGVRGYLPGWAEPEEILTCLRTVLRGQRYLSPSLAEGILALTLDLLDEKMDTTQPLTGRERQIFELIGQGLTSQQIAGQLRPCISPDSVETHRKSIRRKLGIQGGGSALLKAAIAHVNQKNNKGGVSYLIYRGLTKSYPLVSRKNR